MRVGFIGAGKVGKTLGLHFKNKNQDVIGYYSKSRSSAMLGAKTTNSKVFSKLEDLVDESEMILITTTDDAITVVANQLANTKKIHKDHLIVHTSGVHSTEVLKSLKDVGCALYSLHPLQSFADPNESIEKISKTYFTIEGNGIHILKLKEVLYTLKNPYTIIDKEQKELYHAGACVLSNYLITLMNIGFELISASGFPKEHIYSAFAPLLESTLENIKSKGTVHSLTGPISRGDVATIDKHISALQKANQRELEFYKYMGIKTLELVEQHSSLDVNKEKIKNRLMEG